MSPAGVPAVLGDGRPVVDLPHADDDGDAGGIRRHGTSSVRSGRTRHRAVRTVRESVTAEPTSTSNLREDDRMPDAPGPASAPVRFEVLDEHVALVTLDRPEKRNAVNGTMARLLEDAVRRVEDDPDIRVALLASSHPGVFCAGADLSQIGRNADGPMETPDGGFAGFVPPPAGRRGSPWWRGPRSPGASRSPSPATWSWRPRRPGSGCPEVSRGLLATAGGVHRLPRLLPRNVALELLVTGAPIGARRAHDLGLVNRLTEPGGALAAATGLARTIAGNAPLAVQEALAAASAAVDVPDDEGRALAEAAMARLRGTEDYAEGPRAFLEKRPPRWTGR